jgi:spastin
MEKQKNPLNPKDLDLLAAETEGYSGSDLTALAKDAALGPIREMGIEQVKRVSPNKMRQITVQDFRDSLKRIRKSVTQSTLDNYEKWNQEFGDITL